MARGVCVSCLIALAVTSAFAQTCTTFVVVDAFDGKTTLSINNLKAENFEAKSGGTLLPVVSTMQNFNNRVLVLVEATGGTDDLSRQVAGVTLKEPAGRQIAFGVFSEEVIITKDFSGDPYKRSSEIDEVISEAKRLRGSVPALFDSLHQALAAFGPHQPGDTVVLVTNFHDNKSKHNPADLTKEFMVNGTRLIVIFEKKHVRRTRDPRRYVKDENNALQQLSTRTGGMYTDYTSARALNFAWAGYMLGIQLPSGWDKAKEWQLRLKDPNGKTDKKALVVFPQHLVPCAATVTAVR